jgi:hypothetical protein
MTTVVQKCPACDGHRVRLLTSVSDWSQVDYFRCPCGHVWAADKKTAELICHVTPLPEKRID